MTSIQLTVGENTTGAFIFVGDSSDNNGMSNPICAKVGMGALPLVSLAGQAGNACTSSHSV